MSRPRTGFLEVSKTHPRPTQTSKQYRLEGLDGLRAIAAVAVVVYHFLPDYARGGLLGVDVFFVLSGFLITSLLTKEYTELHSIDIKRFWLRRFRRLFPAVAVTVITTVALATVCSHDLLVGIRRQVFGSLTFIINWIDIATGQSYFTDANPQLLRNMWSLAVEQQFYLIWPLVIVFGIMRIAPTLRWRVPLIIGLVSTLAMCLLFWTGSAPTRVYEGTDTHCMGLMLGAALALANKGVLSGERAAIPAKQAHIRTALGWGGLATIVLLITLIPQTPAALYPWGILAASLASVTVIQALFPEVVNTNRASVTLCWFLELRPLVWLGHRSYSLYLWHWPIFLIVTSFPQLGEGTVAAISTFLSLTAAALAYRYVETPMRLNGICATLKYWWIATYGNLVPIIGAPDSSATTTPRSIPQSSLWKPRWISYALLAVSTFAVVSLAITGIIIQPGKTAAQLNVEAGEKALAAAQKQITQAPTPTSGSATAKAKESNSGATNAPTKTPKPVVLPDPLAPNAVSIIGDSVTLAAAKPLLEAIPGVAIDAKISRSSTTGLQIIRYLAKAGKLRPYVVFALATNSSFTEKQANELLDIIGPDRRLVLVTGYGPANDKWIAGSNATMIATANAHPDKVKIANWYDAISKQPNLLASDHIHPVPTGAKLFTQTIKNSLSEFTPTTPKRQ